MASPWGTGTYPPPGPPGQYPPPPPTFQNDQRRQIQFPQPAIPGFYNPAVAAAAQYQPSRPGYSGAISSQFNSVAATGHIPSALQPGGGMHRTTSIPNMRPNGSDFYYQQPPPMPPMQQQYVAPQHHAPPMRHTQSVPPPLPHKPYNQPPLPPKPPLNTPANGVPPGGAMYPQSVVGPGPPPQTSPTSVQAFSGVHYPARDKVHPETRHHHTVPAGMHPQQVANMGAPLQMFPNHNPDPRDTVPDFSQFTPDVKEPPTRPTPRHTLNTPPQEDDEDEELRRVLEMSAKAAEEAKRHKNSKEEEELARALQESLHVNHRVPQPQYGGLDAESSHNVMFPSPETLSSSLPPESSTSNSVSPAFSNSTLPTTAYSYESHEIYDQKSSTNPFTSSPRNFASQIADDEAFARRLMEEEREREEREEQEQREQEERDRREQEEIERREREEKERREREDKERREREDKERREREERDRREREARVRREREEQERREREEREHRERERERERRERTQSQPPPIRPNEQPPPFESSPPIPPAQESPPRTPQPALPLYDDVVSSPPAAPAPAPISIPSPQTSHAAPPVASSNSLYPSMATHHAAPTSHSRQPSPSPSPGPAPTLVRSISANATVTSAPTPPLASLQDTRSGRSQSFTAFGAGPSSPGLRASQPSPTSGSSQVNGAQQISPRPSVTSAHLAVVEERNEPSPQPSSSRPVNVPYVSDSILTANQLVDAELLRGVCKLPLFVNPNLGFHLLIWRLSLQRLAFSSLLSLLCSPQCRELFRMLYHFRMVVTKAPFISRHRAGGLY